MTITPAAACLLALITTALAAGAAGAAGPSGSVRAAQAQPAGPGDQTARPERVRGVIRSVQDTTLVLALDEGGTMLVNVGRLKPEVRRRLQPGQQVVLGGLVMGNHMSALSLQTPGAPAVTDSAPPPPAKVERFTGVVASIDWPIVILLHAGRLLEVDATDLPASAGGALVVDQPITVVGAGFPGDRVRARAVEPAPPDAAASPASAR